MDSEGPLIAAQSKNVARLSLAGVERLLEETRRGTPDGKIPVLVLKRKGGRGTETPLIVIMDEEAFRGLFGRLQKREAEPDTREFVYW